MMTQRQPTLYHSFFSFTYLVCRIINAVLCREESVQIWGERKQFEDLGVRLVCLLHEWRDKEVQAYHPAYWGGELYYDEEKAFHAAVHGGKVRKGNVVDLLNPFSQAWKNMRRAKASNTVQESNLVGDGLTMGGVMVFAKGGKLMYAYPEKTFGDHAPMSELLSKAKEAAETK